jgi:hypothetical protein
MKKSYYVIGGEYADTSFTKPAAGTELEKHGPYTEVEAHNFWRSITGQTVDNAMVRYVVKNEDELPDQQFYVVGGEYKDTGFTIMADGREFEVYGPFQKQQALDFWRGLTSQTIDSATHRYDIVTNPEKTREMKANQAG